jgi:hypothetical protein
LASDRLAFVLHRAGLQNTNFYKFISAIWRLINKLKI